MKEGGCGIFSVIEGNLPIQENDKKESSQKVDLKKQYLEVLEKERSKVSPLGPPERESQLGTFEEGTSKEENSEKIRKWLATNVVPMLLA